MPMGPPLLGSRSSYPGPQDFSPWSREAPRMDERTLPSHAELPVRDDVPPGSSWGMWGEHDVFGTLNLLTPERVLAAARSIRICGGTRVGKTIRITSSTSGHASSASTRSPLCPASSAPRSKNSA